MLQVYLCLALNFTLKLGFSGLEPKFKKTQENVELRLY